MVVLSDITVVNSSMGRAYVIQSWSFWFFKHFNGLAISSVLILNFTRAPMIATFANVETIDFTQFNDNIPSRNPCIDNNVCHLCSPPTPYRNKGY